MTIHTHSRKSTNIFLADTGNELTSSYMNEKTNYTVSKVSSRAHLYPVCFLLKTKSVDIQQHF